MDNEKALKQLVEEIDRHDKVLAEIMPTEQDALKIMFSGYERLKQLGFKEAMYCPKDGSTFEVVEAGSTGIHTCHYEGKWPTGSYWIHDAHDLWPSSPILFRVTN